MKRNKRSLGEALRAVVCVQMALCLSVGGIPTQAIAETAGGKQPIELAEGGAGIEELGGADGPGATQEDKQDDEVAELGDAPQGGAAALGQDDEDAIRPVEEIEGLNEADEPAIASAYNGEGADLLPDDKALLEAQAAGIDAKSVVSMGGQHSAVLDKNGTLWWWGTKNLGDTKGEYKPVKVTDVNGKVMDKVVAIYLGDDHAAAIKTDGSLWTWGRNDFGQLGDGSIPTDELYRHNPKKIMSNVISVSLGCYHSAAVTSDGKLWTWGSNTFGELGSDENTTAIRKGQPFRYQPEVVMDHVSSVSVNGHHTAAVGTDGTLWMWGYNLNGQLGDGSTTNRKEPTKVKGIDNVASVSLGYYHSAAIKKDGSLWTWGYNICGQLGDGTTVNRSKPVKVMDDVVAVSLGGGHSAAIKNDGSLWTWGLNDNGQLGDGATTNRNTPSRVKGMDNVVAVSLGFDHSAAVKSDGTLWTWGSNKYGQLGDGTQTNRLSPVKVMDNVAVPKTSLSGATVTLSPASYTYDGTAKKPKVTVKLGSTTLGASDYSVSYKNNVNVGTATATITGKGCYEGTVTRTFTVASPFVDVTAKTAHAEDVFWLSGEKISEGWTVAGGRREFRPLADVARADMAAFLFRLAKGWGLVTDNWQPKSAGYFRDVNARTAHYREVMWLAESGISEGWEVAGGRREFRPLASVARADMAAFLHRLAELAKVKGPAGGGVSFRDVNSGTAHADDIAWLAATGVSKGWSTGMGYEFRPYANVARADMAAFIHRLDGLR